MGGYWPIEKLIPENKSIFLYFLSFDWLVSKTTLSCFLGFPNLFDMIMASLWFERFILVRKEVFLCMPEGAIKDHTSDLQPIAVLGGKRQCWTVQPSLAEFSSFNQRRPVNGVWVSKSLSWWIPYGMRVSIHSPSFHQTRYFFCYPGFHKFPQDLTSYIIYSTCLKSMAILLFMSTQHP